MTDQAHSESAVGGAAALVIRVWRDTADSAGIKARITRQPDLADDERTTTVVSSPEAVYREVRAWLEQFLQQSTQGGTAGQG
jgi:hypothetical protein